MDEKKVTFEDVEKNLIRRFTENKNYNGLTLLLLHKARYHYECEEYGMARKILQEVQKNEKYLVIQYWEIFNCVLMILNNLAVIIEQLESIFHEKKASMMASNCMNPNDGLDVKEKMNQILEQWERLKNENKEYHRRLDYFMGMAAPETSLFGYSNLIEADKRRLKNAIKILQVLLDCQSKGIQNVEKSNFFVFLIHLFTSYLWHKIIISDPQVQKKNEFCLDY